MSLTLLLAALTLVLVGFDGYLGHTRMRKYGPIVETNEIARQLAEEYGIPAGTGFIVIWSAFLTLLLAYYSAHVLQGIYLGARIGLAICQLKSMTVERFAFRILEAVRKKAQEKPRPPA